MIIEMLGNFVLWFLNLIFGWVNFPDFPGSLTQSIDILIQYITDAIGIIWLIVPQQLVLACLPLIIVVENFDRVYSMVMWILKKIPFLGMK